MLTGWNWIDGQCLYFEEESNGSRGALKRNAVLADGKQTNENGAWIVNGVVQRPGDRAVKEEKTSRESRKTVVKWEEKQGRQMYGKTSGAKEKIRDQGSRFFAGSNFV